jgi:hypothetical protein
MSQQPIQNDSREDMSADEHEPVFVTDRKGIVLVWPDGCVQRFPWSVLRQLAVHNGCLTSSEGNGLSLGSTTNTSLESRNSGK